MGCASSVQCHPMISHLSPITALLNGAAAAGLNLALAAVANRRRMVTRGGAVAGFLLGTLLILFGGWFSWFEMGAFFLSSSLLSRVGRSRKSAFSAMFEKGDNRDAAQVAANGGVGLAAAFGYALTGNVAFLAAVAAAFAESNADTWATELGVLSRRPPVSIIGGRPVEPGMSGGVSAQGLLAAVAGSALVALVYVAGDSVANGFFLNGAIVIRGLVIAACGAFGSIIDSFLGATVQLLYRDRNTGRVTEHRTNSEGIANERIRGIRGIDNDVVNLVSCAAAAIIAGFVSTLTR